MATPSGSTPFPLTGDDVIDATTNGYKWSFSSGHTIKWSLADGFNNEYWTDPSTAVATLKDVFATISKVANVGFSYAGYYDNPSAAYSGGSDITISLDQYYLSSWFGNSTWAVGFFPTTASDTDPALYKGAAGDVFVNINSAANSISYAKGAAGFALALHEIGHALGLKHPHDDGGTGRPTFSDVGLGDFDIDVASVMSYADTNNWNTNAWDPATPMLMDVLALQYLYGPNTHTNATDSTYTLALNNFYETIWDAGGDDLVDVSSSSKGWYIELPNTQLSSKVSTLAGYATPYNELLAGGSVIHNLYWLTGNIENATGSAYGDRIIGSDSANTLYGMSGKDAVYGKGGDDTLNGNMGNDYVNGGDGNDFLSGGADNDTVKGGEGNDVVKGDTGNDTLMGENGKDTIIGREGNDIIIGGAGGDRLYGNAGADTFTFQSGCSRDLIRDFEQGTDIIKIAVDINHTGYDSFADIVSHITHSSGYTTIDFGADERVYISGDFDLTAEDFVFFS